MTMNLERPFYQRTNTISKTELFVTLVKGFRLSNITKNYILVVNEVLDSTLASYEFLLILGGI